MTKSKDNCASKMLFIGYYDIQNIRSAPQVRISSMINAFKLLGCKNIIVGNRWKRAQEQLKWIFKLHRRGITQAYVENSSSTAWPMDLLFLFFLKLNNIKIGIFVRDVYPTFEYFKSRLFWYQKPLYWGWHLSVRIYVTVADHIFLPTKDIVRFLKPRPVNFSALPPAMTHEPSNMFDLQSRNFLYLGGISELYGLDILVKCLEVLSEASINGGIDFVTREQPEKLKVFRNARLQSLHYQEIPKQDKKYLAGIIATHEPYSEFAVNVKLFDYLCLGLPVIITNMRGNAKIVIKEKIGIVVKNPTELPEMLAKVLSAPDSLMRFTKQINNSLYNRHNWKSRAKTVLNKIEV